MTELRKSQSVWVAAILNSLKPNILRDWNNFCDKPIANHTKFIFMGRKKKYFAIFQKVPLIK